MKHKKKHGSKKILFAKVLAKDVVLYKALKGQRNGHYIGELKTNKKTNLSNNK